MTKQELMETYTAEQLAGMAEKRTPFTDKELIQKWKELAEEFYNGYCKVLEENKRLQSEAEKYRKAFENANDSNKISVLVNGIAKTYSSEEIGDIVGTYEEFSDEKVFGKFLPTESIKVADMLINAEGECEHSPIAKAFYKEDKGTCHIFDISDLKQIAEHLLVYCNNQKENVDE